MPRRGENIRKRKDGRWEARVKNADGKYKSIYAPTYLEVKEKIKQFNEISIKISEDVKIVDFETLCMEWIRVKEIKNKQSTISQYMNILTKHLIPYFRNIELGNIERKKINEFIKYKCTFDNMGAKRIQDIMTVLIQIIKYAEKEGYIQPFIYDFEKPAVYKQELKILSTSEQEQLVQCIRKNIDKENIGILLSLYTGLRIGEVCALQWKDIDIEQGVISISKTMQRITLSGTDSGRKTKIIVDTPKSQKSVRVIPVPEALLVELKKMYHNVNPDSYILTGRADKFIEPRVYQNIFKRYLNKAGIRNINYHSLRHTFATRGVEQAVDTKTLSELLGHSTVSFTLERYVHPSMDIKKQNIEKIAVSF